MNWLLGASALGVLVLAGWYFFRRYKDAADLREINEKYGRKKR